MAWVKSGLAAAFCALALTCAVMYMTQEDSTGVVKEQSGSAAPVDASLMQSQGKKKLNAWRQFYAAKKLLPKIKKASPATFKKVTSACRLLQTQAHQQCGKFHCVYRAACNKPCKARFGQPPREVLPLAGNKFYKVQTVAVKEKHAKERNQKELAQKQAAILKIKEHAKHLLKKEADEQERRTKADVVSQTTEKLRKGKLIIAQRRAKMAKEKKERGYHNAVVIKCSKHSDSRFLGCVNQNLIEQKVKASEKKYKYKMQKLKFKKQKHMAWLKKLMEKKSKKAAATYASTGHKMAKGLKAYASAKKLRAFAKQAGGNAAAVYQSGTLSTEQIYASRAVPLPAGHGGGSEKPAEAISFSNVFTDAVPTSAAGTKMAEVEAEHALAAYSSGNPGASAARAALKKAAAAYKALAVEEDQLKHATIKYDQDRSTVRVGETELAWHQDQLKKEDAQLKTLNEYVMSHRAILHTFTCEKAKKYNFNVCYSRAAYRAKLRHEGAIKKGMVSLVGSKASFKASKMAMLKAQKSEAKAVAKVKTAQAGSKAANAAALKATAEANERRKKHLSKLLKLKQKERAAANVKRQQEALAFARQLAGASTKKDELTQLSTSGKTAKWTCKRGHDKAWGKCTGVLDGAYKLCAGIFQKSARI